MADINGATGTYRGFALVRDAEGRPVIDDIENCPKEILDMLTNEEREVLRNGADSHNRST